MSRMALYWIDPASPPDNFPPVDTALIQPDGLLCFGGDLSAGRLLEAYRRGIFPWYSANQPILWWSPQPRCVLFPAEIKVSRSLKKTIRNAGFEFSIDREFNGVIGACAQPRAEDEGTWITREMQHAYEQLHRLGHAHSAEIWLDGQLVGGLYGVAIGKVFYGESMFSTCRDSSKVALCCLTRYLARHDFHVIDCQISSSHLFSLGARDIDRMDFTRLLQENCRAIDREIEWKYGPVPTRELYFDDE